MVADGCFKQEERSLISLLDTRAQTNPKGIFAKVPNSTTTYNSGFRSVTNVEILRAVDNVAWLLERAIGKPKGFPTVAFIASSGVWYSIMVLAGIKVGVKTFLPSPRNSKAAFESLFERLDCRILITTSPEPPSVSKMTEDYNMYKIVLPSLDEVFSDLDHRPYPYARSIETLRSDQVLVLHTSGSTGIPKPLVYTNEFIMNFMTVATLEPPEGFQGLLVCLQSGYFFSTLRPFHIAGIATSLCLGLRCGIIPIYPISGPPPTPQGLLDATSQTDIDWAFLAPSMVDEIGNDMKLLSVVSSGLKYLCYSGGSVSVRSGDTVAMRMGLYQVLGSSEASVFPLIRPENDQTSRDWASVQIHPFFNVKFEQRLNDLYELIIVRRPENTTLQPVFIMFPKLTQYETRDLYRPHPTRPDVWTYKGRIDDVIVFSNGEKTNPVSFEQDVSRHSDVRSALVAGQRRFETSLLIELKDTTPLSHAAQNDVIDKIWPTIEKANRATPAHAQVSKSKVLVVDPSMPMMRAGKGTVQRQATWDLYAEKLESLYAKDDRRASKIPSLPYRTEIQDLKQIAQHVRVLAKQLTSCDDLGDDELFFSRGMESLVALRLSHALRDAFGSSSIDLKTIYDHGTVNSLTEHITNIATHVAPIAPTVLSQDRNSTMGLLLELYEQKVAVLALSEPSEPENSARKVSKRFSASWWKNRFRSHSDLNNEVIRNSSTKPNSSKDKFVVLTGSTGALGSHLLYELLRDDSVKHIYCFNRAVDSTALQVKRSQAQGLPVSFDRARVTFLTVDLSSPNFGLEDSLMLEKIAANTTHIIHNAWPVDFNLPLPAFKPHMDGLINLLSLAVSSRTSTSLLFVSSISSMMRYGGTKRARDQVPEEIVQDFGCPGETSYGESKYISELFLDHASKRLDIDISVVRVGQVAGTSQGVSNWNRNEWFPSLIVSSQYISALPASLGPVSAQHPHGSFGIIDWLLIDKLRRVLVELCFSGPLQGQKVAGTRVYNATNPQTVTWTSVLPSVTASLRRSKSEIRVLPYDQWLELLEDSIDKHPNASDDSGFEEEISRKNPAIRLLDFYKSLGHQAPTPFRTEKAIKASRALANMQAVEPDRLAAWTEEWTKGL